MKKRCDFQQKKGRGTTDHQPNVEEKRGHASLEREGTKSLRTSQGLTTRMHRASRLNNVSAEAKDLHTTHFSYGSKQDCTRASMRLDGWMLATLYSLARRVFAYFPTSSFHLLPPLQNEIESFFHGDAYRIRGRPIFSCHDDISPGEPACERSAVRNLPSDRTASLFCPPVPHMHPPLRSGHAAAEFRLAAHPQGSPQPSSFRQLLCTIVPFWKNCTRTTCLSRPPNVLPTTKSVPSTILQQRMHSCVTDQQ